MLASLSGDPSEVLAGSIERVTFHSAERLLRAAHQGPTPLGLFLPALQMLLFLAAAGALGLVRVGALFTHPHGAAARTAEQ